MNSREEATGLFEKNVELAYWILNKYFPKFSKDEDMIQVVLLGFYKACLNYEESRGTLSALATESIKNEILMEIRRRNRMEKLSVVSLEGYIPNTDNRFKFEDAIPVPGEGHEETILNDISFQSFFNTLCDRDQEILLLRMKGVKQDDVADQVGLSQSYCSRLITKIKKKYLEWSRDQ